MKVWLDDVRPAPSTWVWCKSIVELANIILNSKEEIEEISLDNDLGEYLPEGWRVLEVFEQRVIEGDFIPPVIHIHTANPVAAEKMRAIREQIQLRLDEKNVGKNIIGRG